MHRKAIAVARAGNVIGGGDWATDRLIPDIIAALEKNKKIEIRNPDAVRPWQHVLEPLTGYLLLGARLSENPMNFSKAYNFGPEINDALPVKVIVNMAIDCWGSGEFHISRNNDQVHEAELLKLDISRAKSELKWFPKMNAFQAVERTINW